MQVWKWNLPEGVGTHVVEMPEGARVLGLQLQRGVPAIWALVDERLRTERRAFVTFPTGGALPADVGWALQFVGTYQLEADGLVFHVFERSTRG